jgi:uncharacterized protein YbjT (DUF2867 family)
VRIKLHVVFATGQVGSALAAHLVAWKHRIRPSCRTLEAASVRREEMVLAVTNWQELADAAR